jgi:DNA-binding HxlR family transcriptional regulator
VAKQNALKQESQRKSRARSSSNSGASLNPREEKQAPKLTPTEIDRLIHERMRLGIVSALAVNESLSFNELKKLMRTTDGNLSVHARKLEEAEYITCTKFFEGRMPKTEYRLTAAGRSALERYLNHMEALIQTMRAT